MTAVLEVRSQVEIDAPADEVFAFVADASNNPTWQNGMKSCVWTSHGPIGEASTYAQEASFLGRRITSKFIVSDFDPGHSITIETTESTFPIEVTRTVEPLGPERCRVMATVRGDASGVFKVAEPLMRAIVGRSVRGDYERLRERFARA